MFSLGKILIKPKIQHIAVGFFLFAFVCFFRGSFALASTTDDQLKDEWVKSMSARVIRECAIGRADGKDSLNGDPIADRPSDGSAGFIETGAGFFDLQAEISSSNVYARYMSIELNENQLPCNTDNLKKILKSLGFNSFTDFYSSFVGDDSKLKDYAKDFITHMPSGSCNGYTDPSGSEKWGDEYKCFIWGLALGAITTTPRVGFNWIDSGKIAISDAALFWYYKEAIRDNCQAQFLYESKKFDEEADADKKHDSESGFWFIKNGTSTATQDSKWIVFGVADGDNQEGLDRDMVRNMTGDTDSYDCEDIAGWFTSSKMKTLAEAYAAKLAANGENMDASSTSIIDNGDDALKPNCENTSGVTGWIICPIIDGAFGIMRVVEGAVVGQLKFTLDDIGKTENGTDATDDIKKGHNSMLITANILFAIGIMWIVISQAITGGGGGGFFGAYEAKKMLPKLIAGIIVANLSWELVNLALKVTNAVGDSMKSIIMTPFPDAKNMEFSLNSGSDLLIVGIVGVGAVVMAIFGFFAVSPILIAIVIAILMAMIFAIMRKGMIIILVTFAPIMIALSPFMPNLFKRYYKLLMNLILFYIVVMISVAGCAVIGFITFQGSGGDQATSIGDSLTKLLGIALYFGWMFPVLAFAKNNFDVVGKVGGSLQAAGNKWGRQTGQNRLQGNIHRQERELKKGWKLQRKKEKALDRSFGKMTYGSKEGDNNLLKRGRARIIQAQQSGIKPGRLTKAGAKAAGKIPLVGGVAGKYLDGKMSEREGERTHMMSIAESQVLDASVKKAEQEASYKSLKSIPAMATDPAHAVTIVNSDGSVANDLKGKPYAIQTLNDVYKHLAAGRKVSYVGDRGEKIELNGGDEGMQYLAAGMIGKAGDGVQAIDLYDTWKDKPDTKEGKAARKSLDYIIGEGGGSLAKVAPHVMGVPAATYMSGDAAALMAQKPASTSIGAREVFDKGDEVPRNQMLNTMRELNTNSNLSGTRKEDGMNKFLKSAKDYFDAGGAAFDYDGKTISRAEDLHTALGYDKWGSYSDQTK